MQYYRLNELAEATGVTPRTIRFYIVEGLLPPPQGSGPAAVYTTSHRDRLRLIGKLKARYLSLREIRGRLAALSDAKVRAELQATESPQAAAPDLPLAAPMASPAPSDGAVPLVEYQPDQRPAEPAPVRDHWERIVLADGIELHIRDDRRHERLLFAALIRSARNLLGEP